MDWSRDRVARRGVTALATVAVVAAAVALSTAGSRPDGGATVRAGLSAPAPAPTPSEPVAAVAPALPAPVPEGTPSPPPAELLAQTPATPAARPVPATPTALPARSFADRHPAQAAAMQDPADPATTRWALLIGINEHLGRVADNIGSRQDAEDLRAHLLASGWRDDHILVLTDRQATGAAIVEGLAWLAEKTDPRSTAVFHYSGHAKVWDGRDQDGDGEVTDEGLWPTDDRFIADAELVRLLEPVDAGAMWISFATCNAAGFADQGLARPGRVLTFSSGEPQKSYENPAWGNSVWGFWMIERALAGGAGDVDGDGRVSVEEAWAWARPQASETTRRQRYGPQDPVIVDQLDGDLHLAVPGWSAAPPQAPDEAAPEPAARPERDAAPAPEDREPERQGGYLCILCGSG